MSEEQNKQPATKKLGFYMVAAMWVLLLLLLSSYFSHWQNKQFNPNDSVSQLVTDAGVKEVVLQRNRYGHYVASGTINDQGVVFMLDTGASDISVPQHIAERLGLQPGPVVMYSTANGTTEAYLTRLDRVAIGNISLHNVRAHINPNFDSDEILLGMTFLKHVEFSQKGDTLTLRQ